MTLLWYFSIGAQVALLTVLVARRAFPVTWVWLSASLVQAYVLMQTPPGRPYALAWIWSEAGVGFVELIVIAEVTRGLVRGRLVNPWPFLRWLFLCLAAAGLLVGYMPVLVEGDWMHQSLPWLLRMRAWAWVAELVFLGLTWVWLTKVYPWLPVASGVDLQARWMLTYLAVCSSSFFLKAVVPPRYQPAAEWSLLVGMSAVFLGWAATLWRAPMSRTWTEVPGGAEDLAWLESTASYMASNRAAGRY